MISRVTLGHTPPPPVITATGDSCWRRYIRPVMHVPWCPRYYCRYSSQWGIGVSGLLWLAAYGIFCYHYSPMLLANRVDGGPRITVGNVTCKSDWINLIDCFARLLSPLNSFHVIEVMYE